MKSIQFIFVAAFSLSLTVQAYASRENTLFLADQSFRELQSILFQEIESSKDHKDKLLAGAVTLGSSSITGAGAIIEWAYKTRVYDIPNEGPSLYVGMMQMDDVSRSRQWKKVKLTGLLGTVAGIGMFGWDVFFDNDEVTKEDLAEFGLEFLLSILFFNPSEIGDSSLSGYYSSSEGFASFLALSPEQAEQHMREDESLQRKVIKVLEVYKDNNESSHL